MEKVDAVLREEFARAKEMLRAEIDLLKALSEDIEELGFVSPDWLKNLAGRGSGEEGPDSALQKALLAPVKKERAKLALSIAEFRQHQLHKTLVCITIQF